MCLVKTLRKFTQNFHCPIVECDTQSVFLVSGRGANLRTTLKKSTISDYLEDKLKTENLLQVVLDINRTCENTNMAIKTRKTFSSN